MTGYSPTHIPIPKNHADFERKATVLFREILKDPDAHRLGREGQVQWGIDIVGYDGGKSPAHIGVRNGLHSARPDADDDKGRSRC